MLSIKRRNGIQPGGELLHLHRQIELRGVVVPLGERTKRRPRVRNRPVSVDGVVAAPLAVGQVALVLGTQTILHIKRMCTSVVDAP